jgi:predicted nucleic acid-binding protein
LRAALDTNILGYAEGTNGPACKDTALSLIDRLPAAEVAVPAQVLGELFNVLVRKAGRSPADARTAIRAWQDIFPVIETTDQVLTRAADLAADHRLSIWDSVILAAAAEAGCRLLISEDMQAGFTWGGITIVNPFAASPNPALALLLHDRA